MKCGDKVRLEHILTKKNLHTHDIRSPISGAFEVAAYGNDVEVFRLTEKGVGDTADNWILECEG